jgi:hypothetical protein
MAVWAEQPQILEPVIPRISVDVIHLQVEGLALPDRLQTTVGAAILDTAGVESAT